MFKVCITRPAERDIEDQHDWWADNRSAEQAARWHIGFLHSLYGLKHAPAKCPLALENGKWPFEVRELTFGLGRRPTHRAVFRIVGEQVEVLRCRHLAQDALKAADIAPGG